MQSSFPFVFKFFQDAEKNVLGSTSEKFESSNYFSNGKELSFQHENNPNIEAFNNVPEEEKEQFAGAKRSFPDLVIETKALKIGSNVNHQTAINETISPGAFEDDDEVL